MGINRIIDQKIDEKNNQLDQEIDTIREIMTPIQVAKIVLWANRWKAKQEINFTKFTEEENIVAEQQIPSKKVKRSYEHD